MARFDMFSWLTEKKRIASAPSPKPETSVTQESSRSTANNAGELNGSAHQNLKRAPKNSVPVNMKIKPTRKGHTTVTASRTPQETKNIWSSSPDAVAFNSAAAALGIDAATLIAASVAGKLELPLTKNTEKVPPKDLRGAAVERTPEELVASGAITHAELFAKLNASDTTPEFSALTSEFIIPFESVASQTGNFESSASRSQPLPPSAPTTGFDDVAASLGLDASQLRADAAKLELTADPVEAPFMPINEHQHVLRALTQGRREPKPVVGMPALELAPPRLRKARVTAVHAGGHKVTALIIDADRSYTYGLQKDGSYRLEGGQPKTAPRLLLNLEV